MSCPHCHHDCPHHEPTVSELIERRDWKALDCRFGELGHGAQNVILYEMLKVLLDKEAKEPHEIP